MGGGAVSCQASWAGTVPMLTARGMVSWAAWCCHVPEKKIDAAITTSAAAIDASVPSAAGWSRGQCTSACHMRAGLELKLPVLSRHDFSPPRSSGPLFATTACAQRHCHSTIVAVALRITLPCRLGTPARPTTTWPHHPASFILSGRRPSQLHRPSSPIRTSHHGEHIPPHL